MFEMDYFVDLTVEQEDQLNKHWESLNNVTTADMVTRIGIASPNPLPD